MLTISVMENRNETGRLHFKGRHLRQLIPLNASVIDISPRFSQECEKVEAFITDIYATAYDARITVSYPILMSVRNDDGKILAASGFRYAAREHLFLENYTGAPIENTLTLHYGEEIRRDEIAEIGNLASAGGGASVFLFAALSAYLDAHNVRFATITGTHGLQKRLHALGLDPKIICDADPCLLPDKEKSRWGSYYTKHPRVLSGSVKEGVRHLQRALGTVYEDLTAFYPRLHFRTPI